MVRRIVCIDQEKCNGCGACANACHESAIGMVNGKATLLRDDYCDGMGDCLPECPTGAISFEEREALAYDEEAVKANMAKKAAFAKLLSTKTEPKVTLCQPAMDLRKSGEKDECRTAEAPGVDGEAAAIGAAECPSQLQNWPPQLKLAPVKAPYYQGAGLLIAADCTAFSYGNFHREFMKGKVTLIGCPKLDAVDYSEKLTEILSNNHFTGVTLLRMEVPCCGGLERAARLALEESGKDLPWKVVTISIDGHILSAK